MKKRLSFYEQIRKNKLKSNILMGIIFIVFIILGYLISLAFDPSYFFIIMIISILFSVPYILMSYYGASKIAIASVGAKPASRINNRELYDVVESMSLASGIKMPRLYVMKSEQINAFASGRNPDDAVICVTEGCLKKLNKHELEGVISHEMSHIANYDIRFISIAAIMIGMIAIIAQIFLRSLWFSSFSGDNDRKDGRFQALLLILAVLFAILAPIFAQLVSLAISRKREFTADATGVKFTRYPPGLKSALEKIKTDNIQEKDKKHYSKAIAPLFISDPFKRKIQGLFSTHPPIEERIKRLEKM